jgi:hypothetical protein
MSIEIFPTSGSISMRVYLLLWDNKEEGLDKRFIQKQIEPKKKK